MKLIFRYRQMVDIPGRMITHSCIESGLLLTDTDNIRVTFADLEGTISIPPASNVQ